MFWFLFLQAGSHLRIVHCELSDVLYQLSDVDLYWVRLLTRESNKDNVHLFNYHYPSHTAVGTCTEGLQVASRESQATVPPAPFKFCWKTGKDNASLNFSFKSFFPCHPGFGNTTWVGWCVHRITKRTRRDYRIVEVSSGTKCRCRMRECWNLCRVEDGLGFVNKIEQELDCVKSISCLNGSKISARMVHPSRFVLQISGKKFSLAWNNERDLEDSVEVKASTEPLSTVQNEVLYVWGILSRALAASARVVSGVKIPVCSVQGLCDPLWPNAQEIFSP